MTLETAVALEEISFLLVSSCWDPEGFTLVLFIVKFIKTNRTKKILKNSSCQ